MTRRAGQPYVHRKDRLVVLPTESMFGFSMKTILLADDDPDICSAVGTVLEKRGYRVIVAADGATGLAHIKQQLPDLAIVDMMMPRQSGFRLLDLLKMRSNGNVPVIMITGNSSLSQRDYAEILGVDDYLMKPFSMDRLLESVQRLCPLDLIGSHFP